MWGCGGRGAGGDFAAVVEFFVVVVVYLRFYFVVSPV